MVQRGHTTTFIALKHGKIHHPQRRPAIGDLVHIGGHFQSQCTQ